MVAQLPLSLTHTATSCTWSGPSPGTPDQSQRVIPLLKTQE